MIDHLILPRKAITPLAVTPGNHAINQLGGLPIVHVSVVSLELCVAVAGVGTVGPEAEVGGWAAGVRVFSEVRSGMDHKGGMGAYDGG